MTTLSDELMETARKLDPELWEQVDAVARIIDPHAFAHAHTCTPQVEHYYVTRQKYQQSIARNKAYEILKYLDVAPENYDYVRLFETIVNNMEDTDV